MYVKGNLKKMPVQQFILGWGKSHAASRERSLYLGFGICLSGFGHEAGQGNRSFN